MATLTVQDGSIGIAPTYTSAAAGGDVIAGGTTAGGWHIPVVLLVRNAHTGSWNVTVEGMAAVTVPNGTTAVIPVSSGGGGYGKPRTVTYSGVTALTVAAVRLTPALG